MNAGISNAKTANIAADAGSTILVVEDSDDLRNLVGSVLSARGYKVLRAGNGAEALDIAHSHSGPLSLLLTDISIGGLNGPDVARHLLASHKTDKVLFMSGADDPDIATLGKVVLKPFTLMSLLESVRGTIG